MNEANIILAMLAGGAAIVGFLVGWYLSGRDK